MAAEKKYRHSESYAKAGRKTRFFIQERLKRDQLIVTLLQATGITPNELVHIRAEDVDLHTSSLIVRAESTKNRTQRTIPLSRALTQDLKQQATTGHIFPTAQGNLGTRMVRKIIEKYFHEQGAKATARDLRKNYIRTAAQTTPLPEVKQHAGLQRLDEKRVLTKDEFNRIRSCATTTKEKLFLDIPYETGCTLSELTAIKVKDIEFTASFLILGQRHVPLSPRLLQEIRHYLSREQRSPDAFLFSTRQSATISEKRVYQIIREISCKACIAACPRVLRNSHISRAFASRRPLQDIAEETGIKHLEKFHLYGLLGGDHD